jgi:thiamine kinase-like enzyme
MENSLWEQLSEITENFQLNGVVSSAEVIESGHIQTTFLLVIDSSVRKRKFILQKINLNVFPEPEHLVNNSLLVLNHLQQKTKLKGGNSSKCSLSMLPSQNGGFLYQDQDGEFWRIFDYIENTDTYLTPSSRSQVFQAGKAIGEFLHALEDFPVSTLVEIIPNFHHTPIRYQNFRTALKSDKVGRAQDVRSEIIFILDRQQLISRLVEKLDNGELPQRVTHNDTKISNVLFDQQTGEAVCMIDLDTVMPGTSLYDFGDAARTMTNTTDEDQADLSLVNFNLDYFKQLSHGFIQGMGESLTSDERSLMPFSAVLMTLECGIRFLEDYLNGDTYFKTDYPDHNLVRARVQFKLIEKMEANSEQMSSIISSI